MDRFIKSTGEKYAFELAQARDNLASAEWAWLSDSSPAAGAALRKAFGDYQLRRYEPTFWNALLVLDSQTEGKAESCEPRQKIRRLRQLADRDFLPTEPAIQAERTAFEASVSIREKGRNFLFRLPGEKDGLTKDAFLLRLGQTADRVKRESLYKFFSSARSMKWSEWGYSELVRLRNEEAKAVGVEDFVEYRLIRLGISSDTLTEAIRRIRNRLVPLAKEILAERGTRAGIAKPESWDFEYLKQRPVLFDLNRLLKEQTAESAWGGVEDFFLSLGIDPKRLVTRRESGWARGREAANRSLVLKTPLQATIAGVKVNSAYQGGLSLGGVQQLGFDELRDSVRKLSNLAYAYGQTPSDPVFYSTEGQGSVLTGELLSTLASSKRSVEKWVERSGSALSADEKGRVMSEWSRQARENLILELVNLAFLSELEVRSYTILDKEIADQWADLFKDYYGIETSPFYADWDSEEFLRSPFEHSVRLLAILSYLEWFDEGSRHKGELSLTPSLGQAIRQKLIEPGGTADMEKLATSFTGKSVDIRRAIDGISEKN